MPFAHATRRSGEVDSTLIPGRRARPAKGPGFARRRRYRALPPAAAPTDTRAAAAAAAAATAVAQLVLLQPPPRAAALSPDPLPAVLFAAS